MFKFWKKKPVVEETKANGLDPSTLGNKVSEPISLPPFTQPIGSPKVTSDNGFIGLQRSPRQGLDWGYDEAQLGFFASGSYFIGYQACAMIATNWLVDKACNTPARDAIRNGYLLNCGSEEVSRQLRKSDKRYGVMKNMRELINFGRVYGGRIVLFNIDSANPKGFYEGPFNIDGVQPGTYRGMSQIDPNWLTPELTEANLNNPAGQVFYEPEYWRVKDRLYHRSHLHIFVPYPVPDVLKPTYRYLGVSVPQRILDRAYQAERSANESSQLLMTKRLVTLALTDSAFAKREELSANIESWSMYRDNYGVLLTGEGESVAQHETALGDVDTVIMNQYQLVAAASNVPATKLLGTQPKGFNSTGEYEESVYREELEAIQANDLAPLLERHYQLVAKSEGVQLAQDLSIQWEPLDSPDALEWADINLKKAQTAKTEWEIGAIDAEDERDRLRQDRNSDFHNIEEGVLNEAPNGQTGKVGQTEERPVFRGASLAYPIPAEQRYRDALLKLISEMTDEYERKLARYLKKYPVTQDASPTRPLTQILSELGQKWARSFADKAREMAERMIHQVDVFAKANLGNSLKEMSGGLTIKTPMLPASLKPRITASTAENIALIKSIPDEYSKRIQGVMLRSIQTGGKGASQIFEEIRNFADITKNRAELIAVDQSRKITTVMNSGRMRSAGVTQFEWIHSGGGAEPRELHVRYDGQIFDMDDPPIIDGQIMCTLRV